MPPDDPTPQPSTQVPPPGAQTSAPAAEAQAPPSPSAPPAGSQAASPPPPAPPPPAPPPAPASGSGHTATSLAEVAQDGTPQTLLQNFLPNVGQWALDEGQLMAKEVLPGVMPSAQQVSQIQEGLVTLATTSFLIAASKDPVAVSQAKEQRQIVLSAFKDLEASGAKKAELLARQTVAKLLADGADFALQGLTKLVP